MILRGSTRCWACVEVGPGDEVELCARSSRRIGSGPRSWRLRGDWSEGRTLGPKGLAARNDRDGSRHHLGRDSSSSRRGWCRDHAADDQDHVRGAWLQLSIRSKRRRNKAPSTSPISSDIDLPRPPQFWRVPLLLVYANQFSSPDPLNLVDRGCRHRLTPTAM